MKKKVVAACMTVALAAVAMGGATLAYFTDTDSEENVFTTGKVDIDLVEEFEDGSKLLPGKANAVTKQVWIELENGSEDSYVWYTYAIPAVLDSTDGTTGTNNVVHVNASGATWDTYWNTGAYTVPEGTKTPASVADTWDHDPNVELNGLVGPEGFIGTKTIDGVLYNVYLVLYHGVLTHDATVDPDGTTTTVGMTQVYMDAGVDTKVVNGETVYVDKNGKVIDFDFAEEIKIYVDAYGIQADGFADVYAAYAANPVKIS